MGHNLRYTWLVHTMIEAKEKNARGRQRLEYTKQIALDMEFTIYAKMKTLAENTKERIYIKLIKRITLHNYLNLFNLKERSAQSEQI